MQRGLGFRARLLAGDENEFAESLPSGIRPSADRGDLSLQRLHQDRRSGNDRRLYRFSRSAGAASYCVATAVFFHHDFTNLDMQIHFLKNIAMAGGLLQVVAFGAGAFSLDARHLSVEAAA
jgi:hypothetical protein